MSIWEVVVVAVIASVCMATVNEAGYRIGVIRGNLLHVDGKFTLKEIGIESTPAMAYIAGVFIHLITSAAFGVGLYVIAKVIDIDVDSVELIAPYVLILWLAMLFSALPVAGQGFLGRHIANTVWVEQLFLHFVFGIVLWWGLQILN